MPRSQHPDSRPARKPTADKGAPAPAKAAARPHNVQQVFLDELIRTHRRVSVFLVNGVKLEGEIRSYDRFVILMKNAVTDKVYKHAVSTILPTSGMATAAEAATERRSARPKRQFTPPSSTR